jgi:hypothetical protein
VGWILGFSVPLLGYLIYTKRFFCRSEPGIPERLGSPDVQ